MFHCKILNIFCERNFPDEQPKGGSRHEAQYYGERFLFFIRHFNNSSTLHRNALAAWAACLDPRLQAECRRFSFQFEIQTGKSPIWNVFRRSIPFFNHYSYIHWRHIDVRRLMTYLQASYHLPLETYSLRPKVPEYQLVSMTTINIKISV